MALLAFQAAAPAAAAGLDVVVGIPPLKYLAERIGGEQVRVSVLADGGASPETWEPGARDIVRLTGAELYIDLRLPFERTWLARLLAQHPALERVDCSGDADVLADPHLWTSPRRAIGIARCMSAAMAAAMPAAKPQFQARLAALEADLEQLDAEIQALAAATRQHSFLVHHASWGYLAHDYGLQQIAIEQDGHEPEPRQLAQVIERARAEGLRVVFTERNRSSRSARVIAESLGARIEDLDPLAEDYLANLRTVARMLLGQEEAS